MADHLLHITDLHVSVAGNEIIRGLDLTVNRGSVHALMGPNGSGKSTLSLALMGHPKYTITKGDIKFKGQSIVELSPDERARLGMFLGFQYPSAVPGVSVANFLRNALMAHHKGSSPLTPAKFKQLLDNGIRKLKMDPAVLARYVNDGFSGGEKKRLEILQALVLEPDLEILDETDSGLDIDALRIIAEGIEAQRSGERAILLITHYQRILNYLKPDVVHVMVRGKIVREGGPELAAELEAKGYDPLIKELVEA
ncbi:MAG: Fe-S cluster assembly ATPase SufC [Candidatus Eremiobacteraeota bacterium]|nr:Fe-S cluster assembly ATPase SufC [Candidatus Eremiobacteraeota bacterium]MBV8262648.1 Fe-S cluster assembly ATPase SufC [Candidatus Eremiobacteraeota bacterium]MBV8460781.1 Fe-S cluster assembly ATPase SufC [Candidatus Eremiobacteraeota bacterium]MBV8594618.1 Fe-S cluster assembly ATPase SufC [Candidatus Eremiobacteraeota bacterium]